MGEIKNIFISHNGKDDKHVQGLKKRLIDQGHSVRNFSVDSTNHKDGRRPSDAVIQRLLRMRVRWSSTVICLIGPETHKSGWVNYEIRQAYLLRKRIVGVYMHGSSNIVQEPEAFKRYGGALLGWNSLDKLGAAINGEPLPFEKPDGANRNPIYTITRVKCK